MASNIRAALIDQLPKRVPWGVERIFNLVGAAASIIALLFVFFSIDKISNDTKMIFALTYQFLIIVFLVGYLLVVTQRRLYRYAQAVFHLHLVNHVVRDHLAALELGKTGSELSDSVAQILDSIAACYSILTGQACRVSLKEITTDFQINTVRRDALSAASVAARGNVPHSLEGNTDFYNLWYSLDGCSRYFHSNNLTKDWKARKYENTSFNVYGVPEIKSFFGITWVSGWKLPYKSTMVFPIRYVHDSTKWPILPGNVEATSLDEMPQVWGFLCVDTASTSVFKLPHAAEVGGAFADSLYVLFTFSLEGAFARRRDGNPGDLK